MKFVLIFIIFTGNFVFAQKQNNDCVFDSDYRKLSTEAIKTADKKAKPAWNAAQKTVSAKLSNGDLVTLSLGGCNHFGYFLSLKTSGKFSNKKEMEPKLLNAVKDFFGIGYFQDFKKILASKAYEKSDRSTSQFLEYNITYNQPEESNIIYQTFSYRNLGKSKTEIRANFYAN